MLKNNWAFPIVRTTLVFCACLFGSGCYTPPFEPHELTPVGDVDPQMVVSDFAESIPSDFETDNSITFRFFRRQIAALGYASINRRERKFEIVCVNHMGMQLFHISGDQEGNHLKHALPEFKEHEGFADAIGNDIRRIYFDLLPGKKAEPHVGSRKISFRQPRNDKMIEYVFGGEGNLLLKKSAGSKWRTRWEVAFYEYFKIKNKRTSYVFPRGIVLHNRRYKYRLIIRTRSVDL